MTILALVGSVILGLLLELLLYLTAEDGLWETKLIDAAVGAIVNIFRAFPFIILILLLFPFTEFLLGTTRGPKAALPALIIGSAPFYGRLVDIALKEVHKGVVEAAQAIGANTWAIIFRVLLPESM